MYSREESSRIRHEFWTTFGRYMSPIPSAEGHKINWINYHTGLKDVFFRMEAGAKEAVIFISLEHRYSGIRELYFEQLLELETILHQTLCEEWEWQRHVSLADKVVSRVGRKLHGVSVYNKDQWPDLITFFKPRIIALDEFWENAKYSFDDLK